MHNKLGKVQFNPRFKVYNHSLILPSEVLSRSLKCSLVDVLTIWSFHILQAELNARRAADQALQKKKMFDRFEMFLLIVSVVLLFTLLTLVCLLLTTG